jgi:hypothetical protein
VVGKSKIRNPKEAASPKTQRGKRVLFSALAVTCLPFGSTLLLNSPHRQALSFNHWMFLFVVFLGALRGSVVEGVGSWELLVAGC